MTTHTIERRCGPGTARVLERATRHLAAHGYSVVSSSVSEAHFIDSARRERLAVRALGERLVFEFSAAVPGASLRAPDALEQLVSAATQDTASPGVSTPRRCTVCATQARGDESACAVCGGALA